MIYDSSQIKIKGVLILTGIVIIAIIGIKMFSYIQDLRKQAITVSEIRVQHALEKIKLEEAYQDSLQIQYEIYLSWRKESDKRLDNYKLILNNTLDEYNKEISIIDGYSTVDERIRALRTELSRKDSIPGRYFNLYDN
jgi:uncharacterized protein YjdB